MVSFLKNELGEIMDQKMGVKMMHVEAKMNAMAAATDEGMKLNKQDMERLFLNEVFEKSTCIWPRCATLSPWRP